jgi:DNA-binding CsgD family transcriptional regulator
MIAPAGAAPPAPSDDESRRAPSGDPLLALAVDTLRQAVILFDAAGRVLSANAAARRAIARRPAMSLVAGIEPPHERLRVGRSAVQLRIEAALRACAGSDPHALTLTATVGRDTLPSTRVLILSVVRGQPDLILQLSPMPSAVPMGGGGTPVVLGVLIDRSSVPSVEPGMLRGLFGLTEAESRVAEAYLRADTVKDVALALGISANTVKTHLAAAYQKAGCTRQAQLVRLLMALSELGDDTGAHPRH